MADPIRNFFKSQLIGEYSNVDTSFTISTGDGALLPDPSVDGEYNLVIFEGTAGSSADEFEVVRVTGKSSDALTVTRGQEGTTPITVTSAFHSIIMAATKKTFDDINDAIANVDLTSLSNVESITYDATGDEVLQIPAGTKAQRPTSPSTGFIRFNTDTESIEAYTGTRWLRINFVEVQTANAETASATISAFDATTISNVIENAERLTFNSSGDESFSLPAGTEAQRPSASAGYMRYNTDEDVIEAYIDGEWVQMGSSGYPVFFGNRGLFAGGYTSSGVNTIDYIAIDTTGNANDFGDLTVSRERLGGCSNGERGVFGGGGSDLNTIDYVTIGTTGNATDFGDLTVARRSVGSCSDGSRGLFGSGITGSSVKNTIDYITIDTSGNAIDFGDLSVARQGAKACSNGTRGVFAGGFDNSNYRDIIEFVTIQTAGNATDFGDLTTAVWEPGSCSDGSRGVFGGGETTGGAKTNVIQFITIDTNGNATDFGDLTTDKHTVGACANDTRGVFGGGQSNSGNTNVIEFVTIQTTGNATDFGDLTVARRNLASCSGD